MILWIHYVQKIEAIDYNKVTPPSSSKHRNDSAVQMASKSVNRELIV